MSEPTVADTKHDNRQRTSRLPTKENHRSVTGESSGRVSVGNAAVFAIIETITLINGRWRRRRTISEETLITRPLSNVKAQVVMNRTITSRLMPPHRANGFLLARGF